MTTNNRPVSAHTNIHVPESTTLNARFHSLQTSSDWVFELEIGSVVNSVFLHPHDLRHFANTLQLAIDRLELPHDDPANGVSQEGGTTDDF